MSQTLVCAASALPSLDRREIPTRNLICTGINLTGISRPYQLARVYAAWEYRAICVSVPGPLRPQCFITRDFSSVRALASLDFAAGIERPTRLCGTS